LRYNFPDYKELKNMQTSNSIPSPIAEPINKNKLNLDWDSVIQFILSLLATSVLVGLALLLVIMGIVQIVRQPNQYKEQLSLFLIAAGMFLSGCLLIPPTWLALSQLAEWPSPDFRRLKKLLNPVFVSIAFIIVLVLGYILSAHPIISLIFLPILHGLAIGLPVLFFLQMATRKLLIDSAQQLWGEFSIGLILSPAIIFIAEVTALLGGLFFFTLNPQFAQLITSLINQIRSGINDPETILNTLQPFLIQPFVIFSVLSYGAILVPIIEELIKPLGVWFLAGKNLTPRNGFVAGAICGAGYALFESLAVTSNGQDWVFIILARLGTGVIHITTTALSGWALASAWQKNKYLQLGITYLTVVIIHGLWNGLTLCAVFATLPDIQSISWIDSLLVKVGVGAPLGLIILLVGCLTLLILSNKTIRSQLVSQAANEEI
jgi:hypothetical protein